MSKITKKDFDDYLGKDNFYNTEDKERFYRKVNTSKGWKRHWIPQTISIALVIGVFLVAIQFYQGEIPFTATDDDEEIVDPKPDELDETDWSNWKEAESTDDVDAFYESTIPGFKIATELNQVVDWNKKYSLTDDITLYMDKIWYHEDKLHLFYSMDLSDEEFVANNEDTGRIDDFLLHGEANSTTTLTTNSLSQWSGVVFDDAFNHKLYRVSTITLEDQDQVTDQDQLTASFTIDAHNEDVTLSEIEIPVSYGNEAISSNVINDAIQTSNSTITLNRFDNGGDIGYLFFTVDSVMGQEIEFLSGLIKKANGEEIHMMDRTINLHKNTFVIDMPELTTEDIALEFEYLSMIEKHETIDISVDVSHYERDLSEESSEKIIMNQKVDEVFNTEIYLENITFNDLGVTVDITKETINTDNSARLHLTSIVPVLENWGSGFPNKIEASNDQGETTNENHFHSIGKYIEEDARIHSFGLVWSFIKDANQVDFTIKDLSIGEEINQTIEIPTQK